MSSITITTSSFGAINSTVTGQAPATITLAIGTPGPTGATGPQGSQGPVGPAGPAGPTFTGGDIAGPITMHDGVTDSELSAGFIGFELSSDNTQFAELQYNSLTIGNAGIYTQITPGGLTLPDMTVQTTAFPGFAGIAFESWVTAGFYPLTGNPSAFLVAADISGKANLASPALTGTPTSTTAAASTNTTQIATTAFVLGQASSTTPVVNGTATIGTATTFARADHIHPTDTTRAPLASPALTGTPSAPTATTSTNTTQLATTAFVVGQAGSATPVVDGTAAVGTSLLYARQDHIHPTDTSRAALASPSFTGTPLSTTAAVDTNTTQIATTAYVVGQGYAKLASPTFSGTVTIPSGASISGFAPLASPTFTGTPTLPTGTIATTQTAGDNTTKVATTAFVTAAVPAFATVAETLQQTSAVKTVSPERLTHLEALYNNSLNPVNGLFSAAQSGTGASASLYSEAAIITGPSATTVGYATIAYTTSNKFPNSNGDQINFSRRFSYTTSITASTSAMPAGYTYRSAYGKSTANGQLATSGIGFQFTNSGYVQILAHNGTTLTTTNSSLSSSSVNTNNTMHVFEVQNYGNGTVELFVDGVSYGTGTGGPTGQSTSANNKLTMEVASDGTNGTNHAATITKLKIIPSI